MTQETSRRRDATIDVARGITIIAIVLGHVLRGLASAGILDPQSPTFSTTDRFLYLFHLTVFAFLSGLFVSRATDRDGVGRYLRSRDALFLYLYVLWSLIQGGIKLAAANVVNSQTNLLGVLDLLHPEGQLWFLPWLIVVTTIAALVRPWRNKFSTMIVVTASLAISLAAWGSDLGFAGAQGLGIWVFFFVGVCIGSQRFIKFVSVLSPSVAAPVFVVASTGFVLLVLGTGAASPTPSGESLRSVTTVALGVEASVLGLVAVLGLSRLTTAFQGFGWLAATGRRTLEIFLGSITFASGTRIVLSHLGVSSLPLHIIAGTAAGVVGPILLVLVAERAGIPWLFKAPRLLTGRIRSPAAASVSRHPR